MSKSVIFENALFIGEENSAAFLRSDQNVEIKICWNFENNSQSYSRQKKNSGPKLYVTILMTFFEEYILDIEDLEDLK